MRKDIKAVVFGTIGEFASVYDFTIYTFLAPIIAKIFFPDTNKLNALILTFGIFFMGFLARPVGAILFGHLGDTQGRKKTLSFTFITIGAPTFLIGFLPSYESIGWLAPVLLTALRVVQGLSVGGEFTGSMIYLSEYAPTNKKYFISSLSWAGALFGTLISSLTVLILYKILDEAQILNWGWRMPFLLGFVTLLIGLYIRKNVAEPNEYKDNCINNPRSSLPIREIWKNKKQLFYIVGINVQLATLSYWVISYMPTYLNQILAMEYDFVIILSTLTLITLILLIPLFGRLCDKFSGRLLLIISSGSLFVGAIPVFYLFSTKVVVNVIFAQAILVLIAAIAMAAIPHYMVGITSIRNRYTSISLPYNITYCLLGGSLPLLITYLIKITGIQTIGAIFLVLGAIVTLITLFWNRVSLTVTLRFSGHPIFRYVLKHLIHGKKAFND